MVGRQWTIECGESTSNAFKTSPSLNLRYISPRFKWSNYELAEEEEKHPEKFKNTRLMIELIYGPPLKVLCTGLNVQYRLVNYKRFSLELYGGLKFFLIPGSDFTTIPPLNSRRESMYLNLGLLCQLNLGVIAPFADIGGDTIITIGTELNFYSIFRKTKKRYKLNSRTLNQ